MPDCVTVSDWLDVLGEFGTGIATITTKTTMTPATKIVRIVELRVMTCVFLAGRIRINLLWKIPTAPSEGCGDTFRRVFVGSQVYA